MVECDLAKVEVAGSNPVSRSRFRSKNARFRGRSCLVASCLLGMHSAAYHDGKPEEAAGKQAESSRLGNSDGTSTLIKVPDTRKLLAMWNVTGRELDLARKLLSCAQGSRNASG